MSARPSIIAAVAMLAAGLVPSGSARQLPDLSGTWVLNNDESDDPREQLREVRDDPTPPSGGNAGKRRPSTPRAGNIRRTPGEPAAARSAQERDGDVEGMRIFIEMTLQPARRITIAQPDSTVVLSSDGGRSVVLVTDGRLRKDSLTAETPIEITATWEESGHLLVVRRIEGREMRERYSRSPETDQLIVETHLRLVRGDPVAIRRVYDAATGEPRGHERRPPEREPPARPPRDRPERP